MKDRVDKAQEAGLWLILSKIDGRKAWKSKQETRNELKIKKNCVEENVVTRLKAPVEDRELNDRE